MPNQSSPEGVRESAKMKHVYVVTAGSYSDYSIHAIFSSREAAQGFIDEAEAQKDADGDRMIYWSSDASIEEWPLDEQIANKRQRVWMCGMMLDDGAIVEPAQEFSRYTWEPSFRSRINQCGDTVPCYQNRPIVRTESTVSQAHANKVAAEARQAWLREKGTANV